ncbi:uncharacterized protein N7511_002486 [Penicillium nucicola]|uniref:uncharacterized protein n=1 Tax=Penicillium nucicola TaxID=1850975 RepID=UPI002545182D|nr:uncharacterized protein N7511_002486 [Penicillium nucicola]KAJ5770435.1 hypothetical protein N7511_002486 [Penicillium nucicola]
MAGLHPSAVGASSDSSSTSSNPRFTPVSYDQDSDSPAPGQAKSSIGPLRVETHFDDHRDVGDPLSDFENEYNTSDELEGKFRQGGSAPRHTSEEESEVVKRFDRRLVPFLALLYLLSFLDRSNIGNAKIAGLKEDLHLSSSQYEWLLTAFYITYILFEWMALMYRVVPPHIYISLCVCGWGLVASFQCLATSFWGLAVLRALLGITEAAFGPGVPFYLSLFYRRHELAFRNGLFISAAPLATSFASSLAFLIVKFSSEGPISPWRILFLVEGFPSVVVAVFAWFLIPDSPGQARFLNPRQRMVAHQRLEENTINYQQSHGNQFNWREILKTASDPKAYMAAAQALSAPPYLVAFIVVLVTAYASDRSRSRSPYLIAHAFISSLAYLGIALTGHFHVHLSPAVHTFIRYICVYPATAGFFSAITLIITWSMDNRVEKEGKGASIAILNIIGQCGPLLGTRLYPESDGPWYVRGMAVCSFFMIIVAVLALAMRILLQRMNRAVVDSTYTIIEQAGPVEQGEERDVLMGGGRRDDLEHSTGDKRLVYII